MFKLRNYQEAPVNLGVSYFKQKKVVPSLLVLPTAAGKSIIIAHIATQTQEKTLCIQPSVELLKQNYEKFTAMGGEASIYSASAKTKEFGQVTYATIGSIKNIGGQFKALGYKNLIIDEAHLYPKNSDSMLGKFLKGSGIKKVIGLTATPFRLQNYSNYFTGTTSSKLVMLTTRTKTAAFYKDILHITQIQELTANNYWAKLKYELHVFDTSKLVFNTTKADYLEWSIKLAYKNQNIEQKIKDAIEENTDRESILVFVPSIGEAKALQEQTPNSAVVYSGMPDWERDVAITAFKDKAIRVVFNVNILSVGFDHPELDCIISARPTASLAWLYQALGRGTRIHPNKKDCLIIDFVGNIEKFGMLEDLYFKEEDGKYNMYGSGGKLLTGIDLDKVGSVIDEDSIPVVEENVRFTFGSYKGKLIEDAPAWYLTYVLENHKFTKSEEQIKNKIFSVRSLLNN